MEFKRADAYAFFNVVGNADFDGVIKTQFRYVLKNNLDTFKSEMDKTNALFPSPPEYDDYIKTRYGIIDKFGVKVNEMGMIPPSELTRIGDDKTKELNAALVELVSANEDVLAKVQLLNDEKIAFLDEMVDLDLSLFNLNDIPPLSESNGDRHWEMWRLIALLIAK